MIRNDDSAASGSVPAMTSEVRTWSRIDQHAQRGRDHGLDDRAGDGADRPLDQRSAVVERDDPDAARQADLQLADLRLDPARDLERVLAVGHQDHAAGDLVAVLLQDAPAEAGPDRDRRRPPRAGSSLRPAAARPRSPGRGGARSESNDSSPGSGRRTQPADAPHHVLGVALVDDMPAGRRVRRRDRFDDILERDAEEPEPVGVGRDLVLDREPADAGDVGHAGHGAELRADVPVLDRAEPAQVEPASLDGVPEDLAGRRRVGRQLGRGARGQLPLDAEPIARPTRLRASAESDPVLEDHADHREADVAR